MKANNKKYDGMLGRKLKALRQSKQFAISMLAVIFSFLILSAFSGQGASAFLVLMLVGLVMSATTKVKAANPFQLNGFLSFHRSPDPAEGGGTDEEKALLKTVTDILTGKIEPTQKQVDAINKRLNDFSPETQQKFEDEIKRLAGEVKALQENGVGDRPEKLTDTIKSWIEANKDSLANIKMGQEAKLTPLVVKVASPMTPSNTYNGSAYLPQPEFQAGATEIVRVQPTFWDFLKKGRTGSAAYVWVNKKNPLGAAAFIAPGVLKPGISFEIATEISNAKKIAVSEKCATELLEDINGMASWIEMEIRYQLNQKVNTTLMTGVNSSTVPAGIQTISTTYSLTTVKTTNPTTWDSVRACVAQLRNLNLQGPVTAFMNPIDYANMVLTKAVSQGQYMNNPPETGATIVEDNNVAVGYIQVAMLDYYKILIYKDFQISFGWENDDFTKNLVTTIGEMRLHQFFSENHAGFAIYDTIENIKTAILTT